MFPKKSAFLDYGSKPGGGEKMPTTKKVFTVQNLEEKIRQAKGLILTDYSGLDVSQISQLRSEVKQAGAELEVVKNNLLRLALEKVLKEKPEINIEGPTAVLWLYQEDPSPLKTLNNFIQQNEIPKIKFGFWEQQLIDEEKIKYLATIPGKTELQAKLVGLLKSPSYRLWQSLSFNLIKLLLILKAKSEKGGEN